ncbi:MAG: type II/IV secretion system ATPase subunit [Candidatus Nanoarchaeia archaeon]
MALALKELFKKIKKQTEEKSIKAAETYENKKGEAQPKEPKAAETKETAIRIEIPKIEKKKISESEILEQIKSTYETYPLIKQTWKGIDYVVATATIKFNPVTEQLVYIVEEPPISKELKEIIEQTLQQLQERLDITPLALKAKKQIIEYLDSKINEIWDFLGIKLSDEEILKAKYYIMRDTIGYGKIEVLMRDPNIEDISCDGVGLPVFIFHRNPLYGSMPTNIWFENRTELDAFVLKLAQKAGKTVSVASPLLDATLPDGSRLQVTYGTDIARRGSNFSIRKFFKRPLTIVDLMNYGTIDALQLAYLWLAVENQQSILIAGTTAVGKTTFLNAIANFIRPNLKTVSIEDTAELQLTNVNWVSQVARTGYGPKKYGEVTLFDLLKASLRQRPDVLIVGEVRGKEAAVMFQAMATGHAAMATLHADTIDAVIDRLTTPPISLPLSLLENLDIIVFLEISKKENRMIRRVGKIIEVEGFDRKKQDLITNTAFEWVPGKDEFKPYQSHILWKLANRMGLDAEGINQELIKRAQVLSWMQSKNITKIKDIINIINMYYSDPESLTKLLQK